MSFISDTLSKLSSKKSNNNKGDLLPPGLDGNKPPKNSRNIFTFLIGALLGIIILTGVAALFLSDEVLSRYTPDKKVAVSQIPATPMPPAQPLAAPVEAPEVAVPTPEVVATAPAVDEVKATASSKTPATKPAAAKKTPQKTPVATKTASAKTTAVAAAPDEESKRSQYASLLALADSELRSGNEQGALEYYKKAYAQVRNSEVAYNIVLLAIHQKDPSAALTELKNLTLEESDAGSIIQELIAYNYIQEAEDAVKYLLPKDGHGNIYFMSAYLKERKGDLQAASLDYKTAMYKSEYDPYITFAYARSLDLLKNYAEAKMYYLTVAENADDFALKKSAKNRLEQLEDIN